MNIDQVIGVEINVPGIAVSIVDINNKEIVPNTSIFRSVDTNESLENLIAAWASAILEVHEKRNKPLSHIGLAIPGPFDYENGISLMKNQNKFDALYGHNVKLLLAEKLGIPSSNIKMNNNTPCFAKAEEMVGAAKGHSNVLAFTLNQGLGSARVINGVEEDANLWNKPFKDGIAEDYIGIGWLTKRYEEFTGLKITDIKQLADIAQTDDGIGQLIFNEYGENFVKFLLQYISAYNPDALLIGGHNNAWELFIDHVRDRLGDRDIKIPIISASLGDAATMIGAANLWADYVPA